MADFHQVEVKCTLLETRGSFPIRFLSRFLQPSWSSQSWVHAQLHAQADLLPGEDAPGTHWIRGSVGPRADLFAIVR
jgi:hypothetical protein